MANPELIETPKDVWTKVATAVFTGSVDVKTTIPKYIYDSRVTGDPAPTNKATALPFDGDNMPIESPEAIDVYVMALNHDGSVVVTV